MLQQEQQNVQMLQQLLQREQQAVQVIQQSLQGHNKALQQCQHVLNTCNQMQQEVSQVGSYNVEPSFQRVPNQQQQLPSYQSFQQNRQFIQQ
ncbi:hypothetical protein I7822_10300 [Metabacillus sp. BG109]|uniref:Uncharacterized protein n=2 Tax=Metabacillus bambusae TaxID=2795218 RepID=A0ABS3N1B4_9BACI|nr:hypothetical protein [Metabacillus bambusae]